MDSRIIANLQARRLPLLLVGSHALVLSTVSIGILYSLLVSTRIPWLILTSIFVALGLILALTRPYLLLLLAVTVSLWGEFTPNDVHSYILHPEEFQSVWSIHPIRAISLVDIGFILATTSLILRSSLQPTYLKKTCLDRYSWPLLIVLTVGFLLGIASRSPIQKWEYLAYSTRFYVYILLMYVLVSRIARSKWQINKLFWIVIVVIFARYVYTSAKTIFFTPTWFMALSGFQAIFFNETAGLIFVPPIAYMTFSLNRIWSRKVLFLATLLVMTMPIVALISGRRGPLLGWVNGALVLFALFSIAKSRANYILVLLYVFTLPFLLQFLGVVGVVIAAMFGLAVLASLFLKVRVLKFSRNMLLLVLLTVILLQIAFPQLNKGMAQVIYMTLRTDEEAIQNSGTQSRLAEIANVVANLNKYGGIIWGLGMGRAWETIYYQPFYDEPTAWSDANGRGTNWLFSTHVGGLDVLLYFGVAGLLILFTNAVIVWLRLGEVAISIQDKTYRAILMGCVASSVAIGFSALGTLHLAVLIGILFGLASGICDLKLSGEIS